MIYAGTNRQECLSCAKKIPDRFQRPGSERGVLIYGGG